MEFRDSPKTSRFLVSLWPFVQPEEAKGSRGSGTRQFLVSRVNPRSKKAIEPMVSIWTCSIGKAKRFDLTEKLAPTCATHCTRTLICCYKIVFSVNILEVVLLTGVTWTARTTSTSADTVWGDFAPYRFSSWLSWAWPPTLELVVVGGLQILAVAVFELVLLHLAGKLERLLLEVRSKCMGLSWRGVNSARSGICFDSEFCFTIYLQLRQAMGLRSSLQSLIDAALGMHGLLVLLEVLRSCQY